LILHHKFFWSPKSLPFALQSAATLLTLLHNLESKRQPNTLDCHRLILWAGQVGKAAAMKQRLMELYFSEGGDLTQPEVLAAAAVDCGLDGEEVRALLASEQDVDTVEREAQSAKDAGIDGVPCFIIGGMIALSGAQPPEQLAAAIERAAAEHAKRVAAE